MNNIEKLAIEHGAIVDSFGIEPIILFTFNELEAFAKALQQSCEPVALPTFNEISKNIDDSRFVGHPKLSALDTNNVKTGARIMYDAIYVWLKKQNTRSTVPLEKYNKLLDALNGLIEAVEVHQNDDTGNRLENGLHSGENLDANLVQSKQAIAEAEGKEG